MTDSLIQVRIDSKLKENAENVLAAMGMRTSEAVRIFLQQTINDQAFPFKPNTNKIPNKSTIQAFEEAENGQYTDSTLADFRKSLKSKNENNQADQ